MEQWKTIPGYEGLYQASDEGRIRSIDGKITANTRYERRVWKGRVMKQKVTENRRGRKDARVSLWKDGKEATHLVARLVASAWHGAPGEQMTVNHINGDSMDNRPLNLEWVTLAENIRKGFESGLYPSRDVALTSETGDVYRFRSMSAADRWLGRSNGYVSNAIHKGHSIRATDGSLFVPF